MIFSITFNVASKLRSCSVAATDIAGAEFILNIPDIEVIAVVVIVMEEVTVKRILLLTAVIGTVALLFIGGKVSASMSLIR